MGFGDGVSTAALPPFGKRTDDSGSQGWGGNYRQQDSERRGFSGNHNKPEDSRSFRDGDNQGGGRGFLLENHRSFDGTRRDRSDGQRNELFHEERPHFRQNMRKVNEDEFEETSRRFGRGYQSDNRGRDDQRSVYDDRRNDFGRSGFSGSNSRNEDDPYQGGRRPCFDRNSTQNRPSSRREFDGSTREFRKGDPEYFQHDRREGRGFRSDDPREYQSREKMCNRDEEFDRGIFNGGGSRGARGGGFSRSGSDRNGYSRSGFNDNRGDRRVDDDRNNGGFDYQPENYHASGRNRRNSLSDSGDRDDRDDRGFQPRRDDRYTDGSRGFNGFGGRGRGDRSGFYERDGGGFARNFCDDGKGPNFGDGRRRFGESSGSGYGFNDRNKTGFAGGKCGGPCFGDNQWSDGTRFGESNSFGLRDEREANSDRQSCREFVSGRTGSAEKKRAPRDWQPEVNLVETLFEHDALNAEHFEKDLDDPVTIEGDDQNLQISTWENSGLHPQLIKTCVERCKYSYVRPIQAATIPVILRGKDIMAHAETGGGKTAAFVLPILHYIMNLNNGARDSREGKILALVVSPTRELAKQLLDSFRKHAFETDVKCCVAYGEIPRWKNLEDIHKGCDVLIGTSGRLMDFISKGDINVNKLKFLVLDEADMLLRDGRDCHLERIFQDKKFPKPEARQTLLFSATFPPHVDQLARKVLKNNFVKVSNGARGRANNRVTQQFVQADGVCGKNEKLFGMLEEQRDKLARDGSIMRTLVFVGTKKQADFVALMLAGKGIKAASINGDRPQNERERVIKQFREGTITVLVGTDVCQRGLDIPALEQVINYDMPTGSPEEARDKYIHRIGRTGRLYNGVAVTFVDSRSNDRDATKLMVDVAKEARQEIPQWLEEMCQTDSFSKGGFGSAASGSTGFNTTSRFGECSGFGGGFGGGGFGAGSGFGGMSGGFASGDERFEGNSGFSEGQKMEKHENDAVELRPIVKESSDQEKTKEDEKDSSEDSDDGDW